MTIPGSAREKVWNLGWIKSTMKEDTYVKEI